MTALTLTLTLTLDEVTKSDLSALLLLNFHTLIEDKRPIKGSCMLSQWLPTCQFLDDSNMPYAQPPQENDLSGGGARLRAYMHMCHFNNNPSVSTSVVKPCSTHMQIFGDRISEHPPPSQERLFFLNKWKKTDRETSFSKGEHIGK